MNSLYRLENKPSWWEVCAAWIIIGVMVWGGYVTLIVATFITNMH